jgi:hypothetical protein
VVRDLPALWRSQQWRAGLEAWLVPALAGAGVTVTGPVVQERVRFWSTVLHVETDAGRVWVKENAPSQAFEAGLVAAVERVVPGLCAPALAVDPDRGWLATADLGQPMWHDETLPPEDDWVSVVEQVAVAQRVLADHEQALLATGLERFPVGPDEVVTWAVSLLERLRALPAGDPRRPTDTEMALVDDGLGRIREAAAALAGSGLPCTLQHNDLHLGNAFRRPGGGAALIDLGDAVWAHPLTTLRIPVWILRHLHEEDGHGPASRRALAAGLDPWTDRWDLTALTALVPAAERISCLHRALSWARLHADVPPEVVDEGFRRSPVEWVVDAAAPDPYASAIAR